MALNAYLKLQGQKQGQISGSVIGEGHENSILVHSFSHDIISPRDPVSGLPAGKRQHKPLTLVKEIDTSSPHLLRAFVDNENFVSWELQIWSALATPPAVEQPIYTIRLTNASIASIGASMPDNLDPANEELPLHEEISFTYQRIQWTWTDGEITAHDDWTQT